MQGWRNAHEDAHAVCCAEKAGAFWVLDGHGGDGAANYGAPELAKEFEDSLSGESLPDDERIERGVMAVDERLKEYFCQHQDKQSGSTVVGALAILQADGSYSLKLVNCGDSRAIVVRSVAETQDSTKPVATRVPEHLTKLLESGEDVKAEFLPRACEWPLIQETVDHKPSHPTEKARIQNAGGRVSADEPPRLDGQLAVSRGLGDFEYKGNTSKTVPEQKVSCVPDIYEVTGLQAGSLCILCCDGVWDVLSGTDVARLVRDNLVLDPEADIGDLAADIVKTSLGKSSRDNVTAMVVQLGPGLEWDPAPSDEMKGFEKLLATAENKLEDDARKEYLNFLRRTQFPAEPITCSHCHRWYMNMMQCGCQRTIYCSKACQKKDWKTHKPDCTVAKGAASKGSS